MITLYPIGLAYNERHEIEDDHWGEVVTKIILIVLYQRNL